MTSDDLEKLPWTHFALAGFALAAVYYFLYFDGGAKIEIQIAQQEPILEAKLVTLNETEEKLREGKKFEQEAALISQQLREAFEYLPKDLSMAEVVRIIFQQARLASVEVGTIRPSETPLKKDFYEELLIKLELTGDFGQIMNFLANLTKLRRIINVASVDLKRLSAKLDGPSALKFSGELIGYRYTPVVETTGESTKAQPTSEAKK